MNHILLLAGDGVGPEIMEQAKKILSCLNSLFTYEEGVIGGAAIKRWDAPYPAVAAEKVKKADAVLYGAVGDPTYKDLPFECRPEQALFCLMKDLGLYVNLRPIDLFPSLITCSPLKKEILNGLLSLIIVSALHETTDPRGMDAESGWNTFRYTKQDIEKVGHLAFEIARKRGARICSIDKANTFECMAFWRHTIQTLSLSYPDVEVCHMYADRMAMQLLFRPSRFDVILTPNIFGDIFSDEAAVLVGSLGLLCSASLGHHRHLYEPAHGSAPDIAGQGIANPIGLISSIAMMCEWSFQKPELALFIRTAIGRALDQGYRTRDIYTEGMILCSTDAMGDVIAKELIKLL